MYTVKELRQIATQHNICGRSRMNKKQLETTIKQSGGGLRDCIEGVRSEIAAGRFIVTGSNGTISKKDFMNYMKKYHPDRNPETTEVFTSITGSDCKDLIIGKKPKDLNTTMFYRSVDTQSPKQYTDNAHCDTLGLCSEEYMDHRGKWNCRPSKHLRVSKIAPELTGNAWERYDKIITGYQLRETKPSEYFTVTLKNLMGKKTIITTHPTENMGGLFGRYVYTDNYIKKSPYKVCSSDVAIDNRLLATIENITVGGSYRDNDDGSLNQTWSDIVVNWAKVKAERLSKEIMRLQQSLINIKSTKDAMIFQIQKVEDQLQQVNERRGSQNAATAAQKRKLVVTQAKIQPQIDELNVSIDNLLSEINIQSIEQHRLEKFNPTQQEVYDLCNGITVTYSQRFNASVMHDDPNLEEEYGKKYVSNKWTEPIINILNGVADV